MNAVRTGFLFAIAMASLSVAQAHAPTQKPATQEPVAQEPTIGHAAPPMTVARWVKGDAVPRFEKGKVYVVEFWATWCAPCKRSIPHLTEMAHKYAGRATFIGVDVYDQGSEPGDLAYLKKVKAFVEGQGERMDYRVAVDGPNNAMAEGWLKAYGEGGIPAAFVVRDGVVAWIGHPEEGLDAAVEAALGSDYDLGRAARDRAAAKAEALARRPLPERFIDELQHKNWTAARDLSDQLLASDPKSETTYASARFVALLHTDADDAYAYARKLSDGLYKTIPAAINGLVRTIAEEPGLKDRNLDLALSLAQRAVAQSGGKEPRFLEGLAIVRYERGEKAEAVAVLGKAVKMAEANGTNPVVLKTMRERLARYRTGKG